MDAKRRAAVILEVLAGSRRVSDAAAALGVTVPRYYFLEAQALAGLLAACEPRTLRGGVAMEERGLTPTLFCFYLSFSAPFFRTFSSSTRDVAHATALPRMT